MPAESAPFAAINRTITEHGVKIIRTLFHHLVGLSGNNFIRPGHIFQVSQTIGHENGPDQAKTEWQVDFQSASAYCALVQLVLGQQQYAEVAQPQAIERHRVGLVILAETAGPARSRCKKYIFICDILLSGGSRLIFEEIDK